MSENEDYEYAEKKMKKFILWFIVLAFIVGGITWFFNRSGDVANTAIIRYEEFQDTYNTCKKLNTDLCNMAALPETDKMFEQFSKAQRLNTIRTNLNRWVEDYNAKSKMWNHSLWKSNSLPYQLSTSDFNCY